MFVVEHASANPPVASLQACTTSVTGWPKMGEHCSYRLCLSSEKAFVVLMKIDVFGSYLEAQAAFPKKAREPQLAITISREVGAGGRTIAPLREALLQRQD
jgi:hypothetical protein